MNEARSAGMMEGSKLELVKGPNDDSQPHRTHRAETESGLTDKFRNGQV